MTRCYSDQPVRVHAVQDVDALALVSFCKRGNLVHVLAVFDGVTGLELVQWPDLSHVPVCHASCPCEPISAMADLAHPDRVRGGQAGHEQRGCTRVQVHGAKAVRFHHSKTPVVNRSHQNGQGFGTWQQVPVKVAFLTKDVLVVGVMAGLLQEARQDGW